MTAPRSRSHDAHPHGLGLATAPPPRQNYRQVGTKPTGSVARGGAVHKHAASSCADPQQRVASIPSKYETVLHREPPERNAFGARTNRFGESENERPGPGTYYRPPSLVRTAVESGSVSRLGYSTGFVSKTKRFNDRVRDVVPGPGQYQPVRADHRPQNRKFGMSSFANAPKTSTSNQIATAADAPGPADYNAAQASAALTHNVARSAFASKVARGFAPVPNGAAPGQYDDPLQLSRTVRKQRGAPSSVFCSASTRLSSDTTLTPGPGAYNAEAADAALRYDWIAKAHASAAFQTGSIDRFGRAPGRAGLDAEPGPGSYRVESMADALARKSGSSNVFRSTTTRGDASGGVSAGAGVPPPLDVPGPAFYHPSSPDRRSHLLNANKKWL